MNHEQLSALVDGELAAEDYAPAIEALGADPAQRRLWSRYHVIGDVLRAPPAERTAPAVTSRPEPVAGVRRRIHAPLAGLAIAASVAVVAVLFVLRSGPEVASPGFEVATQIEPRPLAPVPVSSLTSAPASSVVPVGAYDQRLNGYLVNFNEQRSRRGVPGVHPYVRIVGFGTE